MTSAFHWLTKRLIAASFAFCLSLFLLISPFGNIAEAARTSMTGNYVDDTVSVARSLKETIAIPKDAEDRLSQQSEAVELIYDYISRYRNRPQVNSTVSFTTMQTALNAMAGHYNNYKRPLAENVKDRLNQELTKAEEVVFQEN